jgi:homeobox protein CDX
MITYSLFNFQVKIWFQNRRAKERKHMKKRDEIIQKEKLDVAASLHVAAAAAAGANSAAAAHMFGMSQSAVGHMLHHVSGHPHLHP